MRAHPVQSARKATACTSRLRASWGQRTRGAIRPGAAYVPNHGSCPSPSSGRCASSRPRRARVKGRRSTERAAVDTARGEWTRGNVRKPLHESRGFVMQNWAAVADARPTALAQTQDAGTQHAGTADVPSLLAVRMAPTGCASRRRRPLDHEEGRLSLAQREPCSSPHLSCSVQCAISRHRVRHVGLFVCCRLRDCCTDIRPRVGSADDGAFSSSQGTSHQRRQWGGGQRQGCCLPTPTLGRRKHALAAGAMSMPWPRRPMQHRQMRLFRLG